MARATYHLLNLNLNLNLNLTWSKVATKFFKFLQEKNGFARPSSSLALSYTPLAMIAAAIQASTTTLRAAILTSRRLMITHRALQRLRFQTWTHPKPAGAALFPAPSHRVFTSHGRADR
jgi:hypothetical protein